MRHFRSGERHGAYQYGPTSSQTIRIIRNHDIVMGYLPTAVFSASSAAS